MTESFIGAMFNGDVYSLYAVALWFAIGIFLSIALALVIPIHFLMAIGLRRMAQNRGIGKTWTAWVPILQPYLIGELTKNKDGNKVGLEFLIITIGASLSTMLPTIRVAIIILYIFYYFFMIYKFFKRNSNDGKVNLIVSIIVPFYLPIFIFINRNQDESSSMEVTDAVEVVDKKQNFDKAREFKKKRIKEKGRG